MKDRFAVVVRPSNKMLTVRCFKLTFRKDKEHRTLQNNVVHISRALAFVEGY